MLLDVHGHPIAPTTGGALLPVLSGAAFAFLAAWAIWSAWTAGGAMGVALVLVAVVLALE